MEQPVTGFQVASVHSMALRAEAISRTVQREGVVGGRAYAHAMLVLAYIVSAVFEIIGIGILVIDVVRQRAAGVRLRDAPPSEPVELDESNVRNFPGSLALRHRLLGLQRDRELADEHIQAVLNEVLPGSLFRALLGPFLISLGVVIGTVANIAASR